MKKAILVILSVLTVDQLLKVWIKLSFRLNENFSLIPGFCELRFIENEGMAFGWMLPGEGGKLALSLFRIVAVIVIALFLKKMVHQKAHTGLVVCVALILAGAIGNIIDSVIYGLMFSASTYSEVATVFPADGGYAPMLQGKVVDMLHFTTRFPSWFPYFGEDRTEIFPPIFNVADSAISVGIVWIIIKQRTYFAFAKENNKPLQAEA